MTFRTSLVALAIAVASVAVGLTGPVAAEDLAWFLSPDAGVAVYGPVEIAAHVESELPVLAVEFFVDGRSVGVDTEAPWEVVADVGYDNVEHTLRVVARLEGGVRVEASRMTGTFSVDDSLEIELRQLYVNVTAEGERVSGLDRDAFRIFDGGERQNIVTFEAENVPMTAVLLLDCSASMEGERFDSALSGARIFLEGMSELDEAKLLLFSDRMLGSTPFTKDPAILESALSSVEPTGGTAINDYLYASLKLLDGRQGRRVVVLFTDGSDVHSLLDMEDVLWKAQRSQAVVYWIYLRHDGQSGPPEFNSAWRGYEENQEEYRRLRRAVNESGGRIEELDDPDELPDAFAEILEELRNQYVLGYYPSNAKRDGSWREVDVRVRGVAKVRTRMGYIDD